MARVPVSELRPGAVVDRPITNKSGLVLVGEGTVLTDSLIEKIQGMGVESVYVHGLGKIRLPRDQALADLEHRFDKVQSEPFMAIIKNAVYDHIVSLYEEHGSEDNQG